MKISAFYKNILAFLFAIIAIFVIGNFITSPFIWLFLIFLVFLSLYLFLKSIHLENKNKQQTRTLSITAFVTIIQSTIGENHFTIKVINSSIDLLAINISVSNDPSTAITIIIITAVFLFALNYIWERSPSLATPYESGNYQPSILATKVKNDWISGVLKKSIYDDELIELKLQDISYKNAIRNSQEDVNSEGKEILSNNEIKEIFLKSGRKLLITGSAGSGKTTLMLNLIESILDQEKVIQQVPVIISLADWHKEEESSFKDWFISQLTNIYYIPPWLGNEWLAKGYLIPVFEDIDKVDSTIKQICIKNINKFIKEYAINGVILVARTDYLNEQDKFAVNKVLEVLPLKTETVKNYLETTGKKLEGVLNYFKRNANFRNFIKNPFTLSIVSKTFANKDDEFIKNNLNEDHGFSETELLRNYVDRALSRKKRFRYYSINTIEKTLGWLAYNLTKKNKTDFKLEDLQLNWTVEENDSKLFRFIFFLLWGTYLGVGITLVLFIGEYFFANTDGILFNRFNDTNLGKIMAGLSGGFLISSTAFISSLDEANSIRMIGSVGWSWSEFSHFFIPAVSRFTMYSTILYLFVTELLQFRGEFNLYLFGGFFGVFIFILNTSIYKGWKSYPLVESGKPNEGIYLTVKYFIIRTAISTIIVTSLSLVTIYFVVEKFNLPITKLDLYALFSILFISISCVESLTKWKGLDLLSHIGVRLTLLIKGYVPLFFTNFLINCVDRLQLHRKGGRFIFIHSYLQKYYCDLYKTKYKMKSSTNDSNNSQ